MIHSPTGGIHTAAAGIALVAGAVIFLRPKAGLPHRAVGYVYTLSMTVMLATALGIQHLTRSYNALHALALVAAPTLAMGFVEAYRRRPGWLPRHYTWMGYSYMGLVAAFIAETATRVGRPLLLLHLGPRAMPGFWTLVGLASAAVFAIGIPLLRRNQGDLAPVPDDRRP